MTEDELEADRVSYLVAEAEVEAENREREAIATFAHKFIDRVNISKSPMPQYWIWELAEAIRKGEYR